MPEFNKYNPVHLFLANNYFRLSELPSVAVVILNWNGLKHLQQFLPTVLTTTYTNLQVIVADNASTDNSVSYLQTHFPQVQLILLPQNYGFAKGYNEALKKVSADYYLLLNSDVDITPDWIQPMIYLLERSEKGVACQPKIRSFYHKNRFEYAGAAGGWIDLYGYPFARGRVFDFCERDLGQYDTITEVFWASGAALCIKQKAFWEAGGFDTYFFAHQEEIDLCWRLQLLGYSIYCCPQSVVYHVGGGTLPKGNSRKTYLNFRNNIIMLYKNLPWSEKWWKIPYRLMLDNLSALKGLGAGDGGYFIAIMGAHFAFIYWLLTHNRSAGSLAKPLAALTGVYRGNMVWQHFIKGKKTFSTILHKRDV